MIIVRRPTGEWVANILTANREVRSSSLGIAKDIQRWLEQGFTTMVDGRTMTVRPSDPDFEWRVVERLRKYKYVVEVT